MVKSTKSKLSVPGGITECWGMHRSTIWPGASLFDDKNDLLAWQHSTAGSRPCLVETHSAFEHSSLEEHQTFSGPANPGNEVFTSDWKAALHKLGRRFCDEDLSVQVSLLFLGLVWIPTMVMSLLFLCGIRNVWIPAGLLSLALILVAWRVLFADLSRREMFLLSCGIILAVLIAGALAGPLYDSTGDGRWYHEEAILALLQGINPIYQHMPSGSSLYAIYYPKASWYFSALVIHFLNNYQLEPVINFVPMF